MISTKLSSNEWDNYLNMVKRFPTLFIDGYNKIEGVSMVEHHIHLIN